MSKLLSIVVPVYNVEDYVETCVRSLLCGTSLHETEILLIDDGSTDQSGVICDQLAASLENVQVYHKKNGGLSDARNYGMHRACGDYIVFIDSDDFVREDMMDRILPILREKKLQVLLWDADMYDEAGNPADMDSSYYHHLGTPSGKILSGQKIIESQLAYRNDYVTTVWLGVYGRQFLLDHNLWFEKNLLHEDEMWTQKVLIEAKRVLYLKEAFYGYRVRENSIMRKSNKNYQKNIECLIYIHRSLYAYYDWKVKDQQFCKKLKGNTTKRFLHMIGKYEVCRYPNLLARIDRGQILKNANTRKDRIRAMILRCSPRAYCLVVKLLKR